ncbi:hypothetical protein CAI21_18025 [Alkalilimnicola ehrlichii]|nr:hypothetical protein CAI21_18025 [Alkalilimnicola ehrlichii]
MNVEVGLRGFLGDRTQYEVALFAVRTRDEIILVSNMPNEFDNAGSTRRHGVELGLEHFLTDRLSLTTAYTWGEYRFRRFEDAAGNRFDANRLPGLPEHALFAELAWRNQGVYAIVDARAESRVYADNTNTVEVPSHTVVNARLGTTRRSAGVELETFVAINNLANEKYFDNIRVNAWGGRYYEPAPERNFFAGMRARF